MKENDYIDPVVERKAILLGVGFTITLAIIILLSVMLIIKCNDGKWDYNDPKAVIKRERISETDSTETWRTVTYRVVEVRVDTVPKVRRERSTIEPEILAPKVQTVPKDRVDLNDYLGDPDDETDWNYTEIDDEEMKYLEKIGIYWDSDKGYWRKR